MPTYAAVEDIELRCPDERKPGIVAALTTRASATSAYGTPTSAGRV
jgi:hypothetical protein